MREIKKQDKKSRAQASFEFIEVFTFFLAVALIFIAMFMNYYMGLQIKSNQLTLKNFAQEIGQKINTAYLAGNGFQQNFYLPQQIQGENYYIVLKPSEKYLEVRLNDSAIQDYGSADLLTSNVQLIQWNQNQTIENVEGKIIIKPINLTSD